MVVFNKEKSPALRRGCNLLWNNLCPAILELSPYFTGHQRHLCREISFVGEKKKKVRKLLEELG